MENYNIENLRKFFSSGKTLDVNFRKQKLKQLKAEIIKNEKEIFKALETDLGKSSTEAYMSEVGLVLSEIDCCIKHLKKWAKPKKVRSPLAQFPSKSYILSEPLGVVLIMSPWNYPFMLTLNPLIGAIGAGNCAIVKPSRYSGATSDVIKKILNNVFSEDYVLVVLGGREQNQMLLDLKVDYIFFTGGVNVGKTVASKAAVNLTPTTLELGGKSPCIIDKSANIKLAAKRVVFGKFLNCGQTCIAPDYILVHESVKDQFIEFAKNEIQAIFGKNPLENNLYGKIINEKHFDRLMGLIDKSKVAFGGNGDRRELKIEPTILNDVSLSDACMGEEIFGPIMPILTYKTLDQAKEIIKTYAKPLALYVFSNDKNFVSDVLNTISYGGGCVNDTIIHIASTKLPFGGVGESGMGHYHGKFSFDTFSHKKSIVKKSVVIDLPIRYQPYTKTKDSLIRKFLK